MTNEDPLQFLKIVPLKSNKEKELFAKWKHVLSKAKVYKRTVTAYNLDLQRLLQYNETQNKI